jgi:hypothetical protein
MAQLLLDSAPLTPNVCELDRVDLAIDVCLRTVQILQDKKQQIQKALLTLTHLSDDTFLYICSFMDIKSICKLRFSSSSVHSSMMGYPLDTSSVDIYNFFRKPRHSLTKFIELIAPIRWWNAKIAYQRSWTVTGLGFDNDEFEDCETVLSLLVKHNCHQFVERFEFSEGCFSNLEFRGLINTLQTFSKLRSLSLVDVHPDGCYELDLSSLSSLSNLQELELVHCFVDGRTFGQLAQFNTKLMKLYVHEGAYDAAYEEDWSNGSSISSLVNLRELTLDTNCDTGLNLSHLQKLTELTKLHVEIFDEDEEGSWSNGSLISSLVNLRELTLITNCDMGLNLSHLQKLTELTKLHVQIYDEGSSIESLTNLKKLSELSLHSYSGGIVGDIACLENFSKLTRLCFLEMGIHGNMEVLSHLVHLSALELKSCSDIRGEIAHILHCSRLKHLKLIDLPNLRGDVSELSNLTDLIYCDLKELSLVSGDTAEFIKTVRVRFFC